MRVKLVGAALCVLILATGCGTLFTAGGSEYRQGEAAFEAGDYHVAAAQAIAALEKNDEFEEAQDLLSRAVTQGTTSWTAAIEELESSDDPFAYDSITQFYGALQQLHTTVSGSPYASRYPTTDYSAELAAAKESAAEAHYVAGADLVAAGGVRQARQALGHFDVAQGFVPGYKDTEALMATARETAVATVVVYCPDADNGVQMESGLIRSLRQDQVIDAYSVFLGRDTTGLEGGQSLATVQEIAKDSDADILVYAEFDVTGSGNVSSTERKTGDFTFGQEPDDGVPATEYTWSTAQTMNGTYHVIDLNASEEIAADSFSADHRATLTLLVVADFVERHQYDPDEGDPGQYGMVIYDASGAGDYPSELFVSNVVEKHESVMESVGMIGDASTLSSMNAEIDGRPLIVGASLVVAANNLNEVMAGYSRPVGYASDTEDLRANEQASIEFYETVRDRAQQLVDNPETEITSLINSSAAPQLARVVGPILK
jgi:hypothetical protein